jgi:hypothetical protein
MILKKFSFVAKGLLLKTMVSAVDRILALVGLKNIFF